MNDTYIVTTYVVIDDILKMWGFEDDCRARGHAAETLTVAVLAAKYFQNHHERALCLLIRLGYVSRLSVSRFNRQLHRLGDWLYGMVMLVGEVFSQGETFIIDSLPLPVCKRVRARRCRKVRGRSSAATVPPKTRNSSAGACIWSARPRGSGQFRVAACRLSRFDPGA